MTQEETPPPPPPIQPLRWRVDAPMPQWRAEVTEQHAAVAAAKGSRLAAVRVTLLSAMRLPRGGSGNPFVEIRLRGPAGGSGTDDEQAQISSTQTNTGCPVWDPPEVRNAR